MVIKHQKKIIGIHVGKKLIVGIYTIFGNVNFNFRRIFYEKIFFI